MIRIGIISPSEIAFRRFLPALKNCAGIQYVGVAYADGDEWAGQESESVKRDTLERTLGKEREKADKFVREYQGKVFRGYHAMLISGEIDAVYIPLPPALHHRWAKTALMYGLHVLVEKPSTASLDDTKELVELAGKKGLALHENYMFQFHSQLTVIADAVLHGCIGDVRLYRIDFGFPRRAAGDFRYQKSLGGGALLDCGGYVLKYADMLLGGQARIDCAGVTYQSETEVEIFGAAQLSGENGQLVQTAFGMDNDYRCSIDIWGSMGTLTSKRILTAPVGYEPAFTVSKNGDSTEYLMKADDAFRKSIERFVNCIQWEQMRESNYAEILRQAQLVDEFMLMVNRKKADM